MLVNRQGFGAKVQLRSDQDRWVAASADTSYLIWQGVPHSPGLVPSHLFHHSGQSPRDTPESWDNEQPRWVPYHERLVRHFGGLSIFFGGGLLYKVLLVYLSNW